jgi:hypothetical protein
MLDNFRPSPSVAYRVIQDQPLMLLENDPNFYHLNESGRFMWEKLAQGRSLAQVASRVSRRYGLPKAQAESDVKAFAEMLVARGALEPLD